MLMVKHLQKLSLASLGLEGSITVLLQLTLWADVTRRSKVVPPYVNVCPLSHSHIFYSYFEVTYTWCYQFTAAWHTDSHDAHICKSVT